MIAKKEKEPGAPFLTETMKTAIITGLFALAMAAMNVWTQAAIERTGRDAAVKVAEVKTTLEETTTATDGKLEEISSTVEKVHVLTNSSMGLALKVSALALRQNAEYAANPVLKKSAEQIAAAELAAEEAEAALAEHQAKQNVVDQTDHGKFKPQPKPKSKSKAKPKSSDGVSVETAA